MRVIGGTAGGRRLAAPRGDRVRPTADRVKEALFSILSSLLGSFAGARVLDIFAGSGNLGIEALSRGCSEAVFIDNHRDSAAVIRRNLAQLGFDSRSRVIVKEALAALQLLAESHPPFRIVLLDPPYRVGLAARVLDQLAQSALVTEETVVVAECASDEHLPTEFGPLREFDRRIYGDTTLVFFQKGN